MSRKCTRCGSPVSTRKGLAICPACQGFTASEYDARQSEKRRWYRENREAALARNIRIIRRKRRSPAYREAERIAVHERMRRLRVERRAAG